MLAAVAAGFASCSIREEAGLEISSCKLPVTVNASFESTKTVFGAVADGKIPVSWSAEGEALQIIEYADGVYSQRDTADVYTLENNGFNAKFQFGLEPKTASSFDYYAIYPSSLWRAPASGATQILDFAWPVDVQFPVANGPEARFSIMLANAKGQTAQPSELNMKFEHITAYGKFAVKNLSLAEGEYLDYLYVALPAGINALGRFQFNADGSVAYQTSGSASLMIGPKNLDTKSGNFDVWFASAPFSLKAGDVVTAYFFTNLRCFTKTVTVPADIDMTAGNANAIGLDMSTATAPEAPKADKILSLNFTQCARDYPEWPTVKTADQEVTATIDGTDYSFYFKASLAAANQLTIYAAKSYVGLPAIDGYKLVGVNVSTTKEKSSYKLSITSDGAGTNVVAGGEEQTLSAAGDHLFTLSGTEPATRYYLYGNGPAPIVGLDLFYEADNTLPEGTVLVDFAEIFKDTESAAVVSTFTVDGVKFDLSKGTGTVDPKWYPQQVRIYGGNTIDITAPENKAIAKMTFDYDTSSDRIGPADWTYDSGEVKDNVWTGEAVAIHMANPTTKQFRVNKIIVELVDHVAIPDDLKPYEYPEVKNTIVPIVNAFWAETYGGSTTKAVKGATNFDVIESGIQFKADEHGLAVPGATVTSPGVTSFDICANAQTKMYDIYGIIKGNTFDNPHPIYFYTPVDQKIYGDLEFCVSIETGKQIINDVKLEWSSTGKDGDWKPFDNVYSKVQNTPELAAGKTNYDPSGSKQIYDGWAVCEFSIPEAEAIPAGGGFYVKATIGMTSTATDATATTRVNGGFILKNRTVNTEFTGANVLASRNFSDMTRGFDTMLGKPIYYLQFYGCGTAEPVANEVDAFGWTPVGAFQVRRGYVWANSAGTSGALAYYMSPALTALTEPTDIVVTFRAAAYVPATGTGFDEHMGVAVEGPGSVSDVIFDEPCVPEGADWLNPELYKWHRGYAVIKGATAETKVKVGLLEENVGTPRFLLDDIVITK